MSKNNFDRLYEELKNKFVFENALNTIKTLLLNPNATHEEYKKHLHLVELIEENEEEVMDSKLYNEVMGLLDTDKVSMDSLDFNRIQGTGEEILKDFYSKAKSMGYSVVRSRCRSYSKYTINTHTQSYEFQNFQEAKDFIDIRWASWSSKGRKKIFRVSSLAPAFISVCFCRSLRGGFNI